MAKKQSVEASMRAHFAAARAERAATTRTSAASADRLAVRNWQQGRLARTHAALLNSDKYGPAANFFLTELYSSADLTQRDADIEKVIKVLVKFLPDNALRTLDAALEMDALSEKMDKLMAESLRASQPTGKRLEISGETYRSAYNRMGEHDARLRQIALTREIGLALDKLARKPLLRQLLRVMGRPAQIAGVGGLHAFLESGYTAFAHMGNAQAFIDSIVEQELCEHNQLVDGISTDVARHGGR